jgi:ABC-2 type transport system ATP-binding protein
VTAAAIETERLTKRFRLLNSYRDLLAYPWRRSTKLAIDDLTLTVNTGELFGLLGENGAGKTTLIRMLSTTLLPTSGRALVAGHDVAREPHPVRRRIGLVAGDDRSFYWRLTGRQNLNFFGTLYHLPSREMRARVDALLGTLGIEQYADRLFHTYSSGTRQRFAIARGLLTDPELLFLDEPTRSLDPMAADELRRYISEHIVGDLGRTVLLATHTLAEAESICSRVGIIRHGRLVAVGSVEELRRRTKLSTVVDLVLDAVPAELKAGLDRVPGVLRVATAAQLDGASLRVEFDGRDGTLDSVLRLVIGCGAHVQSCVTRPPTLEEIYRAVHAGETDEAAA